MPSKKILITGMSGLIGTIVRQHLEDEYSLRALNRRPVQDLETHQADIANLEAIQPAFENIDTVIHLAAELNDSWPDILQTNIVGTYNVFEAARRADVKRVVFASSGSTMNGWEREAPYNALVAGDYAAVPPNWPNLTHEIPPRPNGLYGCSKAWGEALGRHFADVYGLSTLCLRIGRVNPENRPVEPRGYAVWLSHRDIAQMVEKCIKAPDDLLFDTFFATSDNAWGFRDLSHPRDTVGYKPQDAAEDYRQDN